jgi:hypothetical protein
MSDTSSITLESNINSDSDNQNIISNSEDNAILSNSENKDILESSQESSQEVKEIKEDYNLSSSETSSISDDLKDLIQKEYSYPESDDPDLQYKIYKKIEFNTNKIPERIVPKDYAELKEYRDKICVPTGEPYPHQAMLSNFINPDTPYRGVLVFHGLGTGKTCAAIACAEKFVPMIQKYGTKIYVLVNGPILKEQWKRSLLICTGDTYRKYQNSNVYLDESQKQKLDKQGIALAMQNYKFMSYKTFYKRVLGERIVENKTVTGEKIKTSYKKSDSGDFEREISGDRIYNLNNSLIIVDEAHNLTGNSYGEALKYVIKNSFNLKVLLLTATPMKNLGSDIIELLNFIRPLDTQIQRDKIFTDDKIHLLEIKSGGLDYFKKMASGYVSHVRGADPLTYATQEIKGETPQGLNFIKVTRCFMTPFQLKLYEKVAKEVEEDSLDRRSEAVANFVFPALDENKKLIGISGGSGLNSLKNQLKQHHDLINKLIAKEIIKDESQKELLYLKDDGKTITGDIMKLKYLKYFSVKFYKCMKKLNRLFDGKKGARTAFVYSNLVRVGIQVFQEILLQNGYLEYQENYRDYKINKDTICYLCGKQYVEHIKTNLKRANSDIESSSSESSSSDKNNISASSEKYEHTKIPDHEFRPATFITVTGKATEEEEETLPEGKMKLIDEVFNNVKNKNGQDIKLVLGSKVMTEGISLKNVAEVHILDVHYNLGKVDQVIGRAIRYCSHYKIMSETDVYPKVAVYKYVVSMKSGLTTEEILYQKAESKYLLIKKLERAMKEVAIDCPLNIAGNMFPEEIEKFEKCGEAGHENCPTICDFTKCDYKCESNKLNITYYDPKRRIYKAVNKKELDYSTFNYNLMRKEIDAVKKKIKELYIIKNIYTIVNIIHDIHKNLDKDKIELFDDFFIYKALDELIPETENDFNNFKDIIIDKYSRQGYLIYRNKYYIFQPFEQNENISMYYRSQYQKQILAPISLYNYLKNTEIGEDMSDIEKEKETKLEDTTSVYEYDMEYYDNRDEFKFVGIIDRETSRRKSKKLEELEDIFKIRNRRDKILEKKRGVGIPSLKGAVCVTAKDKKEIKNYLKEMGLKLTEEQQTTRTNMCDIIKEELLRREKYALDKDKNKLTYIMIPKNHSVYKFPYNLEDRIEYIKNKLQDAVITKLNIEIKTKKHDSGKNKNMPYYEMNISKNKQLEEHKDLLKSLGAVENKNDYFILID